VKGNDRLYLERTLTLARWKQTKRIRMTVRDITNVFDFKFSQYQCQYLFHIPGIPEGTSCAPWDMELVTIHVHTSNFICYVKICNKTHI
jgi:hypothetical protein